MIEHHPFTGLKPLKTDKRGRVRFLSAEDEERLRAALIERETELRAQRDRFNHWRAVRHKTTFPVRDQYFVDYIRPIVLLAMNTGMRRAEILGLRWVDVDLNARLLTVTGAVSKNRQSRHIPLNVEAKEVLTRWKAQRAPSRSDEVVFGGHKGEKMLRIDKAWAALREVADLPGWRLHDLRHHFASRLVQEGTDLNVVRELLGHADITMVLRYAHLDPTNLAVAVERVARTATTASRGVRA
ncbi:MAG TPA: site-specific integrase [Steroidobacteraceae bacterium]